MMTRLDLARNFVVSLEQERYRLNLTQAQMAARLGMCLSAYKKMILGGTRRIDLYNAYVLQRMNEEAFLRMMGYSSEMGAAIAELHTLSDEELSSLNRLVAEVKEQSERPLSYGRKNS